MYDQSVEEYLEHAGKKGMKWGKRSASSNSTSTSSGIKKNEEKPKMSNKKKAVIAVSVTTTVAGAAFLASPKGRKTASTLISKLKNKPTATVKPTVTFTKQGKPVQKVQFKSYSQDLKKLKSYVDSLEKDLGLPPATASEIAAAGKKLGFK